MIAENLKIVTIKIDFFISINIIPLLCLQKGFSNDSKKKSTRTLRFMTKSRTCDQLQPAFISP